MIERWRCWLGLHHDELLVEDGWLGVVCRVCGWRSCGVVIHRVVEDDCGTDAD